MEQAESMKKMNKEFIENLFKNERYRTDYNEYLGKLEIY